MARQFVDTNVLVYAHDHSAGAKRAVAGELVSGLVEARSAAISVQVMQELFVTLTRKIPRPMAGEEAAALVADLGALTVHAPGAGDVLRAVDIHRHSQVSFWDAVILQSASALGCDVVWSEDLSAGQSYGGVVVRNPFA